MSKVISIVSRKEITEPRYSLDAAQKVVEMLNSYCNSGECTNSNEINILWDLMDLVERNSGADRDARYVREFMENLK